MRPEFDLPKWKGLKLERPVREFTDADVDEQLEQMLSRHGQLVPLDGPAGEGDYRLGEPHVDGTTASRLRTRTEAVVRIRPALSFRDGKLEGFDKLMTGAKAGDKPHGRSDAQQRRPERRAPRQEGRRSTSRCWKSRS